ncbi:OmpH family outer membrane protein [Aliifodinibius salicampi]|uniref:OmpH family outer membrane protein n=1 Tax=Fodinibius salicampi TaxID=1920655 RepID=A0ABT3Q1X4_9BACT|nr:OmpH family outer membrane protein [Fodinibius salicampi]MCW9714081.1 OmpH family outer membrane protein [Fodinibius salicampi]
MIKRILPVLFIFLLVGGFSNTSFAQVQNDDLTIGYVDPQAILSKMPEMKAVQQRLQNFMESKREEFASKQEEYQQKVAEYQDKESVISEDAKQQEEERLGQMGAELQQYQSQLQQEIQQKQQELVGPLLDQIDSAINTVANERGLSYVLNTTTSNGDVILLYVSDEAQQQYDITDEVMDELDM